MSGAKFKQTEIGKIPEDWEVVTVPDVASNFDNKRKPLSSAERSKIKGNYPYYGAAGIIDYVNDFKYEGDFLLIAEDGTVTCDGSRPMLQLPHGKFWVSNHAHVLQCKSYKDTLFLYYQLKNTSITPFITGAVQPKLSQVNLNKIKFLWTYNDDERHNITKILLDLDSKIELNQQMNKTLEAIAQAIFKHWFVDFEFPNEEGKPYKSSGGETVYNEELGKEVPKGWKVLKNISEMCDKINYGYTESASEEKVGPKFLRVTDINKCDWIDWATVPYCKIEDEDLPKYQLEKGDIVIARMADPGKVAIYETNINAIFASYLIRIRFKNPEYAYYLYYLMKSNYYQNFILGAATGSVQKSLNAKGLTNGLTIVIPSGREVGRFNLIINQVRSKINENLLESLKLSQIRDSLLPKLMSGKIRVPLEVKT